MQEKLGKVTLRPEYYQANASLSEFVKLSGKMEESFDEFEVFGLFKNGTKVLDPFLDFTDLRSNSSFRARADNNIYNLRRELLRLDGRTATVRSRVGPIPGVTYQFAIADFPSSRFGQSIANIMPFKTISLESNQSDIDAPLADWELDKAAGINEYAPIAPSTSINSTNTLTSSGNNSSPTGKNFGSVSSVSNTINGYNDTFSAIIGGSNYSMAGLTNGINVGGTNIVNNSILLDLSGSSNAATRDFTLHFKTSRYVKLDGSFFQPRLSRWMATNHRYDIPGQSINLAKSNSETLRIDNSALHNRIIYFITSPLYTTFHYWNGNYQYRISYRYPGHSRAPAINKSFNINFYDETLR